MNKLEYSLIMSKILINKDFDKMAYRQMAVDYTVQKEDAHNRLTHSLQVANNINIMTESISMKLGFDIDPKRIFSFAGLFHDIGHTAFAHTGEIYLNKMLMEKGIGFDGNANNFVVLKKSKMMCLFSEDDRNYILASLAKHPNELYPEQTTEKTIIFNEIMKEEEFLRDNGIEMKLNKTLGCQIMDRADENCYLTTDLVDARSLLSKKEMKEGIEKYCDRETAKTLINALYKSKAAFRDVLSDFSILFAGNFNLINGKIVPEDKNIENIRIAFRQVNAEFVLKHKEINTVRGRNEKILSCVFGFFIENKYSLSDIPSEYYRRKLSEDNLSEEKRLILVRNMLGALTDKGIKKIYKALKKGSKC